jgi:2-polyprenyl-6-methoxyphenol hydroxylase-like FAD-dependent oxidoreductase
MTTASKTDILVVGAGPTGLVLALCLAKLGVSFRIIDKAIDIDTTSRALAVQARTLEYYHQLGIADEVVARGHPVPALNLWAKNRAVTRVPLQSIGRDLSPYPFPLIFPQDEHERLLVRRLAGLGAVVERGLELMNFEQSASAMTATLQSADGKRSSCTSAYIAGCDGAHSKVREISGIGFPGGTYDHLFYVADVRATGPTMNGELHVDLDVADFIAVFPLKDSGRARLIGSIRDDVVAENQALSFSDVHQDAVQNLQIDVQEVNWFSSYRVHHRVADRFRAGRAFLLGDAAHIHSPVGGQGMNTGIGDAVNLAWKLATAVKHGGDFPLLETYQAERIGFARQLVATTDRAFKQILNPRALARFVRTDIVPRLVPPLFRLPFMRKVLFRTVSQIGISYRGSPLSSGRSSSIRGGDRLPWVRLAGRDDDNYAPLASLRWQFHVYGEAPAELATLAERRDIPLHVFSWQPALARTPLTRNAIYLIRPDGYIAYTRPALNAAELDEYLKATQSFTSETRVVGITANVR